MTFAMVRLKLDAGRLAVWAAERRLAGPGEDLGYAVHCALVDSLGEAAPKPFRLLEDGPRATLLAYGRGDLDWQQAAAGPVGTFRAPGPDWAAAKPMPTDWPTGRRLRFEVRVRPVRRTDRDGDRTLSQEIDAFLLAAADRSAPKPERQTVYARWLQERIVATGAAQLDSDSVRLSAFRRVLLRRRHHAERRTRPIESPDAVLTGLLTVTDGPAFAQLLARGIGRGRAFGHGMLLLKPA